MAISIPSPLVDFILLGPLDDRRQLQDSPILGDVWVEFGKTPDARLDLLIEPYKGKHAGAVAVEIAEHLPDIKDPKEALEEGPNVAFLQSLIVARLTFEELLRFVVPLTKWWEKKRPKAEVTPPPKKGGKRKAAKQAAPPPPRPGLSQYNAAKLQQVLSDVIELARRWHQKTVPTVGGQTDRKRFENPSALDRFVALTGLILWAGQATAEGAPAAKADDQIALVLQSADVTRMAGLLYEASAKMMAEDDVAGDSLVWQVSLNRPASPAISLSVPAVKADAAKFLFKVNCSDIAWAVVDSGIDSTHPCFQKPDGTGSRVVASYDFYNFRRIVSVDNLKPGMRARNVEALMRDRARMKKPPDDPDADLLRLVEDARRQSPLQWNLIERFVRINPDRPPTNHGTHVAGIIGASKEAAQAAAGPDVVDENFADGMCPDIQLYDFRVLGPDIESTEFAVIGALQFIRHLNERHNHFTIHGVNLSLSIPHHVRNYACGRTPVCDECERLVGNGVVVVAAAGNHGYKSFETREGLYDSYAAFSITDPGNAEDVITVGSTHRFSPHTYGVSFFSSRGPTGDGRLKPDIVAPGERIRAPFPGNLWDDLDGTSMAAPHVSGAAAMLMARYSELVGQPGRVKRILCDSATDLGRERSFQGHGMLDVLRAFQSI